MKAGGHWNSGWGSTAPQHIDIYHFFHDHGTVPHASTVTKTFQSQLLRMFCSKRVSLRSERWNWMMGSFHQQLKGLIGRWGCDFFGILELWYLFLKLLSWCHVTCYYQMVLILICFEKFWDASRCVLMFDRFSLDYWVVFKSGPRILIFFASLFGNPEEPLLHGSPSQYPRRAVAYVAPGRLRISWATVPPECYCWAEKSVYPQDWS